MKYFPGWHQVGGLMGVSCFDRCLISVNRLEKRKKFFKVKDWILDAGSFTRLTDPALIGKKGKRKDHLPVERYAEIAHRFRHCGNLLAVACQDYLCTSEVLQSTGLTVADHQRLTIERYDQLLELAEGKFYVMPILQGSLPKDYLNHLHQYGDRIKPGAWVGVGSLATRHHKQVEEILFIVKAARPDLRLHGFAVKKTGLRNPRIRDLLHSADSQAHGLVQGKSDRKYVGSNNPEIAITYAKDLHNRPQQQNLFELVSTNTPADYLPLSLIVEWLMLVNDVAEDKPWNREKMVAYGRYLEVWETVQAIALQLQPIEQWNEAESFELHAVRILLTRGRIYDNTIGPRASSSDAAQAWNFWMSQVDVAIQVRPQTIPFEILLYAAGQQRWELVKWSVEWCQGRGGEALPSQVRG